MAFLVVTRAVLYLLNLLVFLLVGSLVSLFSLEQLVLLNDPDLGISIAFGIILGSATFFLLFSRIVDRGVKRIEQLPHKTSIFNVQPPRVYIIVLVMMASAIVTRFVPVPTGLLGSLYLAVALAKLGTALKYLFVFYRSIQT